MTWFANLQTAVKLALSAGALLGLLVLVSVLGLSAASSANAGLEVTFKRDFVGNDLARRAQIDLFTVGRDFRAAMIEEDQASKAAHMRKVEEADADLRADLVELEKALVLASSRERVAELKRAEPEYMDKVREVVRLSSVDPKAAQAAHAALGDQAGQLASLLTPIVDAKKQIAQATFDESRASYATTRNIIIGTTLAAILVGIFLSLLVSRSIARPLADAVAVLDRVSNGDLTARLDLQREDEIGKLAAALNRSLDSIRSTLQSVTNVSLEVSAASAQLAASASAISGGAQAQAASLEETAASLEEISSTVKQNTDNAQEASQLASNARDTAERGSRVVASAVAAMSAITTSSKKIADIITTIDEIAFQTNLLALNAAVEAARAGEQGRGFGVVASEVRSLAQRTGTAAKEIRSLIADSSSKVEMGVEQVNESGKTLDAIVKSVKRVTDMVAEIAAASREQNTGLDQVNTAVTQVDQVTQSNAAQTEELSATATSLSDKSTHLQELVAAFDLGTEAGAEVAAPRSTPRAPATKPRKRNASPTSKVVRIRNAPPVSQPSAPSRKTANGFEEF